MELSKPDHLESELSRALHRLIKNDGIAPGDIAVLTGRSRERSVLGAEVKMIGAFPATTETTLEPDRVLVQTVWRFKGLERPAVVLCELEDYVDNDGLLYAAVTRARLRLVVIGTRVVVDRMC